MEEQEELATALLQDSHDELMAGVNKTYVVEDPFEDELNDEEDVEVESTGAGAGGVDTAIIVRRTLVFLWPSGAFRPIMWQ